MTDSQPDPVPVDPSPPTASTISAPEDLGPAWHPIPDGRQRWWDGTQWTEHYHPPAVAAPKVKKPGRKVPLWALVATSIVALLIGVAAGNGAGVKAQQDAASLRADLAAAQQQNDDLRQHDADVTDQEANLAAREADLEQREAAIQTTEDAIAASTIPGSGTFLVNVDIQPGTYRSENNSGCYWERLSGTSGTFDDIIANGNVDGQAIITIAGSDIAFNSSRCGDWEKVG